MFSRETIEMYRRMSPSERLALTLDAIRASQPYLFYGPPDAVDRRFALLRKQNDQRNRSMLQALADAERRHAGN